MKASQYIKIEAPMITSLKLKGYPLLLFALITGYTRAGRRWQGSLEYTAKCLDTTKAEVCRSLRKLIDAGLIVKYKTYTGNLPKNEYVSKYDELGKGNGTSQREAETSQRAKPHPKTGALARVGQYAILP